MFFLATVVFVGAILVTLGLKLLPLSLALFAGVSCMMSSVNNVMTSVIPLYSRDKVDSGFMAGLLNTFCYVGSTLATSLLGRIADTKCWNDVFVCILIFLSGRLYKLLLIFTLQFDDEKPLSIDF